MDSDDIPVAHSMDTTWFAVDRDGYVACFRSGEAGAAGFVIAHWRCASGPPSNDDVPSPC